MHPNAALIDTLYAGLARRDGAAMSACYGPDATFTDPVFELAGAEVGAMWSMLCARARDLAVEWGDVTADASAGRARWEARYRFAATGRTVHNRIASEFTFAAGRIVAQRDTFDFRAWARQAFGVPAFLPGAVPFLQRTVRRQARRALDQWIDAHRGALRSAS